MRWWLGLLLETELASARAGGTVGSSGPRTGPLGALRARRSLANVHSSLLDDGGTGTDHDSHRRAPTTTTTTAASTAVGAVPSDSAFRPITGGGTRVAAGRTASPIAAVPTVAAGATLIRFHDHVDEPHRRRRPQDDSQRRATSLTPGAATSAAASRSSPATAAAVVGFVARCAAAATTATSTTATRGPRLPGQAVGGQVRAVRAQGAERSTALTAGATFSTRTITPVGAAASVLAAEVRSRAAPDGSRAPGLPAGGLRARLAARASHAPRRTGARTASGPGRRPGGARFAGEPILAIGAVRAGRPGGAAADRHTNPLQHHIDGLHDAEPVSRPDREVGVCAGQREVDEHHSICASNGEADSRARRDGRWATLRVVGIEARTPPPSHEHVGRPHRHLFLDRALRQTQLRAWCGPLERDGERSEWIARAAAAVASPGRHMEVAGASGRRPVGRAGVGEPEVFDESIRVGAPVDGRGVDDPASVGRGVGLGHSRGIERTPQQSAESHRRTLHGGCMRRALEFFTRVKILDARRMKDTETRSPRPNPEPLMTTRPHLARCTLAAMLGALAMAAAPASAQGGISRTFEAGSLVIPMDLAYQDSGLFQAYGLVYHLLREGVTVYWVIDGEKVWHAAPCDTPGDECAWDCAEEGSGIKCTYPSASPDFFVGALVLWDSDDVLSPGATIASHGYRGGPFVVDAVDAERATAIVDAYNDPSLWDAHPWAMRTEFNVVSVHETTEAFEGNVRKEMVQPPTIAVFADGNEDIATGYLRAAGIPQSTGAEFPAGRCGADCGPGTANPDLLTVPSIMGDMGTCDEPNTDHRNGALFHPDGSPAYCQIMSMHWGVNDRETVECDGGGCPATQAECDGETFTYHGHEVVAEVREFLSHPTHFFAECQAVNAYENQVPNPAWPYLDDEGREGHFLTTVGLPDCPCDSDEGDFECVIGGCDDGARDCCMPSDDKERGAGFLIGERPGEDEVVVHEPGVPYNQMDGAFGTVGGSEPAYTLSSFLGVRYKNDRDITFITGAGGVGTDDVWMTGYVDGECDILSHDEFADPEECQTGKVSYLGGHRYSTDLPMSSNPDAQGARLFLNALFEADCVTGALAPDVGLAWIGRRFIPDPLPIDEPLTISYSNTGASAAVDATLTATLPAGVSVVATDPTATMSGDTLTWDLGSLEPGGSGMHVITTRFEGTGIFELEAVLTYGSGMEERASVSVRVAADRDGDGRADEDDEFPDDPTRCGDSNGDGCDDCASGTFDPALGCGGDGGPRGVDGGDGGCGCRVTAGSRAAPWALLALLGVILGRRRWR